MHIDVNCDTGEGIGADEALMPYITSANISCGYHAGDEQTMRTTILLAQAHNVSIGAHPSFNDKENFGRTEMQLLPNDVYHLVYNQLEIFKKVAVECGASMVHVKPHGALYNMAAREVPLANAIALATKDFDPQLVLFGLSGSCLISEAKKVGLRTKSEVFADRTYGEDGSLTPRSQPGALIENVDSVVQQVREMINEKNVTAANGKVIPIVAETVCLHGDANHALEFAKALHQLLTH